MRSLPGTPVGGLFASQVATRHWRGSIPYGGTSDWNQHGACKCLSSILVQKKGGRLESCAPRSPTKTNQNQPKKKKPKTKKKTKNKKTKKTNKKKKKNGITKGHFQASKCLSGDSCRVSDPEITNKKKKTQKQGGITEGHFQASTCLFGNLVEFLTPPKKKGETQKAISKLQSAFVGLV